MDVSPTIIEGRTLLPIRFTATPLNADVGWDGTARKATVSLGTNLMELWIGQSNALVNGKTVPIDADNSNIKPLIINGRTMLPLRFVTENLGCDVQWDQAAQKVTITGGDSSAGIGKIPSIGLDLGKVTDISKVPGKIPDMVLDPGKITLKPDLKSDDTTALQGTWARKGQRDRFLVPSQNWDKGHGRDTGYPALPVQIPACGTTVLGS